jgi:hypothetical protein
VHDRSTEMVESLIKSVFSENQESSGVRVAHFPEIWWRHRQALVQLAPTNEQRYLDALTFRRRCAPRRYDASRHSLMLCDSRRSRGSRAR